jgi:hypothetical protein
MENKYEEQRLHLLLNVIRAQIDLLIERVALIKVGESDEDDDLLAIGGQIEDLLGVAFVIVQTATTHIVSTAYRIANHAKKDKQPLSAQLTSKHNLLKITNKPQTPYTKMEILDAAANMFKHKDEWGDWNARLNGKATVGEKQTLNILIAAGCKQESFGNFKKIYSKVIGTGPYDRIHELIDIYIEWKDQVSNELMFELTAKGLM